MSAELIARLREFALWIAPTSARELVVSEAADALEAAEAKNARLRAELAGITMHTVAQLEEELTAAEAKLAEIEPHIHVLRHWDQMQNPDPRNPDLPWAKGLLDDVWRILHPDNEGDEK